MVYCCMVWGCQNRPDRDDCRNRGVSFHRLPVSDLNLLQSWIAKIGVTNYPLSRNLRICSEHFEIDNFVIHKDGRRVLKRTAVPSLFNFPADNVQAMFPAFPLHDLTMEDLRSLKGEPTTPNSMIAKMGQTPPTQASPANLSLKDNNDYQNQIAHAASTRWSLLPDGKNMIDSPYSIGDEFKPQLGHEDLRRSSDNCEGSPAAAETPGASSTVSGNAGLNGHGNGHNSDQTIDNLPTASPLVVVGQNGGDDDTDGGLIDVNGLDDGDGTEGADMAEPIQKRFKDSDQDSGDQNVNVNLLHHQRPRHHPSILHSHLHLNKFHPHSGLLAAQTAALRRPRQRKAPIPRPARASPTNTAPQVSAPNQPQQQQQQAAAMNFMNLLNGANLLQVLQQQQQQQQDVRLPLLQMPPPLGGGALDLSVRNLPTPTQNSGSTPSNNPLARLTNPASMMGMLATGNGDINRVRSLILGYRESASFLAKAADELENFMSQAITTTSTPQQHPQQQVTQQSTPSNTPSMPAANLAASLSQALMAAGHNSAALMAAGLGTPTAASSLLLQTTNQQQALELA